MLKLYGIKACDTCRKAKQVIEKAGKEVDFIDVRETPLTTDQLKQFLNECGEVLINRRSTTWRALDEIERQADPITLLTTHPTLMKRPVIQSETALTLGWDATAQAAHLG